MYIVTISERTDMMKKSILRLITVLILGAVLCGCGGSSTFSGSKTGDANHFDINFDILNTSYTHDLNLNAGEKLDVTVEKTTGEISLLIQAGEESPVYQGDNMDSANFQVGIEKAGKYTITVTGKRAAGHVNVTRFFDDSSTEISSAEGFAGGSGTEEDPYQIATKEQLKLLADLVNSGEGEYASASYVLNNDIEINSTDNIDGWATSSPENGWTVIGSGEAYCEFEGHFNGQGHTVSGLFYYGSGGSSGNGRYAVGMFGIVGGDAVIENVTLKDSRISAFATYGCGIGGIVGETSTLSNAVIRNCENYADIVGEEGTIGGVVGVVNNGGSVENCKNSGSVRNQAGSGSVGGVVGTFSGYKLTDCENNGEVIGNEGSNIGGVVGNLAASAYLASNIKGLDGNKVNFKYGENIVSDECFATNLSNYGKVTRSTELASVVAGCGGVIGDISNGGDNLTVSGLVNEGEVSGPDNYLGGVIGYMAITKWVNEKSLTTISNIENHVELNSVQKASGDNTHIGGIIGYLSISDGQELAIEKCNNLANLNGSAGGIINTVVVNGGGKLSIKNCENSGKITSEVEGTLGGIICSMTSSKSPDGIPNNIFVENCVNSGSIEGQTAASGGIIGWAQLMNVDGSSFAVQGCENKGDISMFYSPGAATANAPSFAAGIVGWLGTEEVGTYDIVYNTNTGNVILHADGVGKDTLTEEMKYYRVAAIIGMECDNATLSNNKCSGNLVIPSVEDATFALPEVGMEISLTEG